MKTIRPTCELYLSMESKIIEIIAQTIPTIKIYGAIFATASVT